MFTRYFLTVSKGSDFIYEKYFKSINQAISCAVGFDSTCTIFLYDSLRDAVLNKSLVDQMMKEFRDA